MIAVAFTALLLGLLAIGIPVGFALGISGSLGLLIAGGPQLMVGILSTAPLSSANSYELLTVPMFILMAEFMIVSGIAGQLFACAARWVGRVPGGLAIATAIAGAGFGAISGSSIASAATLATTSLPAMIEQGYEPKLASGVVAISGTLAMLIPPSIALIIYGLITDISVAKLLIAGFVPGLVVAMAIILTVLVLVLIDPSRAPLGPSYSLREKLASLRVAGPMLVLLLAVTGVIYLGIATPTEAAGSGAFVAFCQALISGRLDTRKTINALVRAGRTTCMVIIIVLGAHIFGYFLAVTQATQSIVSFVGGLETNRYVILIFILLIFLLLGCFLDTLAILFLMVPIVMPVIAALDFDLVWFGVLVVVTCEVGLVTPPVGMNCFVVARYTGQPLHEVFAGVLPHIYAHFFVIALLIMVPELITWLPSKM